MKIYVATSFQNIPEARAVMEMLKSAGHIITHDWTKESVHPSWSEDIAYKYLQRCGAADFEGVESADALVLINHTALRDGMAEMGMALGRGQPVFVLYPDRRVSVFFHRAQLCESIPELLARVSA